MALAVTLVNDGEPTEGTSPRRPTKAPCAASSRCPPAPASSSRSTCSRGLPAPASRSTTTSRTARCSATVEVRILEQSANQFAIVGDGTGILRAQLSAAGRVSDRRSRSPSRPADIPDRPEPSPACPPSSGPGQRRTGRRPAARHGALGRRGRPADRRGGSGLAGSHRRASPTSCRSRTWPRPTAWSRRRWLPGPAQTRRRLRRPRSRPAPSREARALVSADDGTPLLSMRPIGAGRVILVGPDLATDELPRLGGLPGLWARLLPTNAMLEPVLRRGFPMAERGSRAMMGGAEQPALARRAAGRAAAGGDRRLHPAHRPRQLPRAAPHRSPRAGVGHRAAAGRPVHRVLVRHRRVAQGQPGRRQPDLADPRPSTDGGSAATVETLRGDLLADRATYDLIVEADALFGRLRATTFDGRPRRTARTSWSSRATRPTCASWPSASSASRPSVPTRSSSTSRCPEVTWRTEDGEAVGTVTNNSRRRRSTTSPTSAVSSGGDMVGERWRRATAPSSR